MLQNVGTFVKFGQKLKELQRSDFEAKFTSQNLLFLKNLQN